MNAKKPIDTQCADCEFSYAKIGDYCFRHPEIVCPHPLIHTQPTKQ